MKKKLFDPLSEQLFFAVVVEILVVLDGIEYFFATLVKLVLYGFYFMGIYEKEISR